MVGRRERFIGLVVLAAAIVALGGYLIVHSTTTTATVAGPSAGRTHSAAASGERARRTVDRTPALGDGAAWRDAIREWRSDPRVEAGWPR